MEAVIKKNVNDELRIKVRDTHLSVKAVADVQFRH